MLIAVFVDVVFVVMLLPIMAVMLLAMAGTGASASDSLPATTPYGDEALGEPAPAVYTVAVAVVVVGGGGGICVCVAMGTMGASGTGKASMRLGTGVCAWA